LSQLSANGLRVLFIWIQGFFTHRGAFSPERRVFHTKEFFNQRKGLFILRQDFSQWAARVFHIKLGFFTLSARVFHQQ
jgi:hypothetical protein